MGSSATVKVHIVDKVDLNLFEGNVENLLDASLGRAAPSAAPSLRKRGPRPLAIGGRGRLPNQLANPRRDSVSLLGPSMYFHDALLIPTLQLMTKGDAKRSILAVDARGAPRPIAMVRRLGMAMALWAATEDVLGEAARVKGLAIVGVRLNPEPGGNSS